MKKTMLALLFMLGCGTLFAETHFSIGIGIGGYGSVYAPAPLPPPPPPPEYEVPPCPGDGYAWVDGYWNPMGGRYYWRPGYWRAPAYYGYGERRGYARGYGWREGRGYDRDRYDRGWRDDHRYGHNEWRHEDRHGRRDEGWRR